MQNVQMTLPAETYLSVSRKTFLGLCRWSMDHRGLRRSWVDPDHVKTVMPVNELATLVCWFPEGFDQDGRQWIATVWDVPWPFGVASARFYMLHGRLKQLLAA